MWGEKVLQSRPRKGGEMVRGRDLLSIFLINNYICKAKEHMHFYSHSIHERM